MNLPIYLDSHATTPADPRVVEAMLPYFTERFGNPASRNHAFGWAADEAVTQARGSLPISSAPRRRTSSSRAARRRPTTWRFAARPLRLRGRGNHIITTVIEHRAVLGACRRLEGEGFDVTLARRWQRRPRGRGRVAARAHRSHVLVSVMAANNEIGRGAAARGDRRACAGARRAVPFRRRASVRQDSVRRGRVSPRSGVVCRAQDVRPQGHRCAVRPATAGRRRSRSNR